MKICIKCSVEKEICDFIKSSVHKDGVSNICKLCNNERGRLYRKTYPEKKKESAKKYKDINRDVFKSNRNRLLKKRRQTDILFVIKERVRRRIRNFLIRNNISKTNKTFDIVGCSPEFLKEYLEKQFTDGMSWDNRGEWHIDHIIPLSSAKDEEEVYRLCHYTNLQPLWAEDNILKGGSLISSFVSSNNKVIDGHHNPTKE
jgi:hypothetical protein